MYLFHLFVVSLTSRIFTVQVLLVHSSGAAPDPRWRDLKTNQDQFSKSETQVVLARFHDFFLQARAACKYANYALPNALEFAVGILCRVSKFYIRLSLLLTIS